MSTKNITTKQRTQCEAGESDALTSISQCENLDGKCGASWCNCDEVRKFASSFLVAAPRPKIVTICGSSRFVAESAVKAWELNRQGIATFHMPLLPQWYPGVQEHHQAETEGVAANLDNLWLRLIEMSDEIFVMNCAIPGHEDGYIGERTRIEIDHAMKLGKPVLYFVKREAKGEAT